MVIWLIGLSGAGKSVTSKIIYEKIKARHKNTVLLDGDILRVVWGDDLGHDLKGREKNAERLSHLSRFLDQQGIHVVAAVLSIFPKWRLWNRDNFSEYHETFLDVDFDELVRRDSKGLYALAREGNTQNVVGVDLDFPRENTWDLQIDSPEKLGAPEQVASEIIKDIQKKFPQSDLFK